MLKHSFHFMVALIVMFMPCQRSMAQAITLDRPGDREFIVDQANLISNGDEQSVRLVCDKLLTDTASPIIVVTIESMAKYTRRDFRTIETFAKVLFDQWGIGHLAVNGQAANTGILFLVARDDRKARIELGIGWEYEKETATQQIMNKVIVPRFRSGDYSGGIRAGVEALDQMVRRGPAAITGTGVAPSGAGPGSQLPLPGGGGGGSLIGCGGFGLVVVIVAVVLIAKLLGGLLGGLSGRRSGYGGYRRRGPGMGTGLLGGLLLGQILGGRSSQRSRGFGGGGGFSGGGFRGGFGGGSFGGGFSGGRGASGSW